MMRKKYAGPVILLLVFFLLSSTAFWGCKNTMPILPMLPQRSIFYYPEDYNEMELPSRRLDIVHFRHECLESYYIGEALMEILQEEYLDDVKQGRITYRRVKSQFLENSGIVFEYGAMSEDFITHFVSEDKSEKRKHHYLWYIAEDEELLYQYLREMLHDTMIQLSSI